VAEALRAGGRRPYVVPRGGATPVGTLAYAQALGELSQQLDQRGVVPQLVLVGTGSGGTQAGLIAGTIAADLPWRIEGASVSRPPDVAMRRVATLAGACADRLGTRRPRSDEVRVTDARGPGYGQPSTAGERCARLAAVSDGILLDPVYAAKALALLADVVDGPGPVVFWHTGGTAPAIAAAAARVGRPS
jgi:D-cysteine desulfhydrase